MGNLVFQATLGGQVNLVGPNTASTYNISVPTVTGTMVTTGDTGTVTNTMLAGSIANAKLTNSSVTIGSTSISLGATSTTLAGLTSVASNTLTSASATNLTIQSAGTTAMTIDTSQNVGIGTSSPTAKLTVSGNQSFPEKTAAYIGVDIATSSGNGGNFTVKAGAGSGAGNTAGNLYLGAGRGNASASSGAIYFGTAQATNAVGLDATLMTLDSSGNLGLGVTPSAWNTFSSVLQLPGGAIAGIDASQVGVWQNAYYNSGYKYKSTAAATFYQQSGAQHIWYNAPSGTAGNAITFTQAMTLDASGRLGIGTTSPYAPNGSTEKSVEVSSTGLVGSLYATATQNVTVRAGIVSDSFSGLVSIGGITGNYPVALIQNNTERARIDTSGNLLVGTTNTSSTVVGIQMLPNGNGAGCPFNGNSSSSNSAALQTWGMYYTTGSQWQFYVDWGGTVHARSTSISSLSDQREKTNIKPLETGLSEVLKLQPRRFDWIDNSKTNVAGFIAQEVQTVLPDLIDDFKVDGDKEERLGLRMGDMIPTLVKAIQEQQTIIEQLKADVAALKGA